MGACFEYSSNSIGAMPIKLPDKRRQQEISTLVDQILSLNANLSKLGDKQTSEHTRLEDEIAKTDREIDALVYDLYSLTEE